MRQRVFSTLRIRVLGYAVCKKMSSGTRKYISLESSYYLQTLDASSRNSHDLGERRPECSQFNKLTNIRLFRVFPAIETVGMWRHSWPLERQNWGVELCSQTMPKSRLRPLWLQTGRS